METFISILHIVVAFALIALVLVQDTKSGSVGVFGGGGSNSVLGATGATTLAQKLTRWTAVIFALTSILLSIYATRGASSVLDSMPVTPPAAAAAGASAATGTSTAPATEATAPAAEATAPTGTATAPATQTK